MLASRPVRAAGERVGGPWPGIGALGLCFCAFFFGGGDSPAPLVWIGAVALVLAALLLAVPAALDGPGRLLAGGLGGLPVGCGLPLILSVSPAGTRTYTNPPPVFPPLPAPGLPPRV